MGKVKVYTAEHCAPCKEVEQLIKEGKVSEAVELIDVETDDGFQEFSAEVLSEGDGAVPSAYKDGQACKIRIVDDTMEFECPTSSSPREDQPQ